MLKDSKIYRISRTRRTVSKASLSKLNEAHAVAGIQLVQLQPIQAIVTTFWIEGKPMSVNFLFPGASALDETAQKNVFLSSFGLKDFVQAVSTKP